MKSLLLILLGFGLCELRKYLNKRSETCEIVYLLSVLLVSAGIFIITLASLVRMGHTNLENVLPFFNGFGIAFVIIGMIVSIGSVVYAIKRGSQKGWCAVCGHCS